MARAIIAVNVVMRIYIVSCSPGGVRHGPRFANGIADSIDPIGPRAGFKSVIVRQTLRNQKKLPDPPTFSQLTANLAMPRRTAVSGLGPETGKSGSMANLGI